MIIGILDTVITLTVDTVRVSLLLIVIRNGEKKFLSFRGSVNPVYTYWSCRTGRILVYRGAGGEKNSSLVQLLVTTLSVEVMTPGKEWSS